LAAPNASAGVPTFRAIVASDIPTLNQNTTGSAATLTTARTIGGVSFNGSANINLPGVNTAGNQNTTGTAANVTGTVAVANGGTGITSLGAGVATFLGTPSSANLAAAVTNETGSGALVFATSPTLVTPALGTPSSGTLTNCTFPTLNQNTTGTAAVSTAATVTTSATASAFKVPFANTTASTTGNYGLLQDSEATFTYNPSTNTLVVGTVSAALSGNATTATTLQTARTINGVSFNGSANITITAAATNVNTQLASLGVGTASSGTAGEIRATNNITAYYSDDRLKTKLGNIEDALAKVRTLSGFYYEANETAQALGYKPVREVGVSAQQVQAVQPEIVVPAPIDDKYLTVRYDRLVPLLIEAIKELDGELQSIKQQLKD
jgi:hypothetical protein